MGGTGGRPKSDIWEHVTKLEGKRKQVRCNYCGFVFAESAHRIRSHLFHTNKNNGIRPCPRFPQSQTIDDSNQRVNPQNTSKNVPNNLINSQGSPTILDIPMNHETVPDCYISTQMEMEGIQQRGRKQVGPFSVSNKLELNQSDLQLIQYVFNMSLSQSDTVFSSSYFSLNRLEFTTLKPQCSLYSSVIDNFADYLTDIKRKSKNTSLNWYLPLMFSTAALNNDVSFFFLEFVEKQGMIEKYMSNLEDCEKIFIPVHIEKNAQGHYYLYVIHWKKQQVQILDSLSEFINEEDRHMTTEKLLVALDELFRDEMRCRSWAFKNFQVTKSEDIPSHPIGYDCGIFVMNFMQESANYVNKIPSFQFDSDEERLELALKLLKSDQNKERERVYDGAKQQYANGRDEEGSDLGGIKRKRVDDTCKEFISKDVPRGADTRLIRNTIGMEKGHTKGYPLPTRDLVGQQFQRYKDEIWKWLMEDEVSVIGVWGMGGVGKTTLVTHIHNILLEDDAAAHYDHVIWVTVSHQYSISQLQRVIATSINLDVSYECEVKRISGILLDAFKQMNKCVVILDDVWDYIPLEEVGFPILDHTDTRIQLILTTRSWEVCQSMNCKDNIIRVEPLGYEDGRDLFKKTLGLVSETMVNDVTMNSVMNECEGLPLAINTIARSMKGKQDLREWKHMYERLQNLRSGQYDMDKWVFPVLRSSYDHLSDAKLQEFFLDCAMLVFKHGIVKGDMIPFVFDDKWIDENKSLNEQLNECHIFLIKLKNNSLLFEGVEGLKIHRLVRVLAIRILEEKHKLLMQSTSKCLTKIPDEREWAEDLEKVFLIKQNIAEILDGVSPRCGKLSTLSLKGNENLKFIGDDFFINMPALRVLDLSHTAIARLPNSISNLECLVALLLSFCKSLKHVPSLAKLQRLIWLDLSHTSITEAPQGLELLINLRHLNLLGTQLINMSTTSIIPKLTKLEHLYLNCIAESMDVRSQDLQGLKELEIISVNFCDVQEFNACMTSPFFGFGLKHYCLNLSKQRVHFPYSLCEDLISRSDSKKVVRLVCVELGNMSVVIPADVNQLYISKLDCCNHVGRCLLHFLLFLTHLVGIEECGISECHDLEYFCCLSSSCDLCSSVQFVNKLELCDLRGLRLLCMHDDTVVALAPSSGPCSTPFYHVRHLTIRRCNRLKKQVTPHMSAHLQNLEELSVESCASMEEIFSTSGEDEAEDHYLEISRPFDNNNHVESIIRLPKLKYVWLDDLPQLNFVCKGTMLCHSSLRLTILKGSCPKLEWPLQTEKMMPNGCTLREVDGLDGLDFQCE